MNQRQPGVALVVGATGISGQAISNVEPVSFASALERYRAAKIIP